MSKLEHKIILMDQDDTVVDFYGGFYDIWRKEHPNLFYIPPDQRSHYTIRGDYPPELQGLILKIYLKEGFYFNLRPLPGALDALKRMRDLGLTVPFCTSPPDDCPHWLEEKPAWINKWLGPDWKIIMTSDKTEVPGDKLVDDNPHVKGKYRPSWEHVIFDQPYNQQVLGPRISRNWSNWEEVLLG